MDVPCLYVLCRQWRPAKHQYQCIALLLDRNALNVGVWPRARLLFFQESCLNLGTCLLLPNLIQTSMNTRHGKYGNVLPSTSLRGGDEFLEDEEGSETHRNAQPQMLTDRCPGWFQLQNVTRNSALFAFFLVSD